MGGNKILLTAALVVTAGLLFFAKPSEAVHKGAGGLTCGQCHTMHNSQGRETLVYQAASVGVTTADPSMILLRGKVTGRQNIHNLCLQCHGEGGAQAGIVQNGSNVTPPKVYLGVNSRKWQDDWEPVNGSKFNTIGAGGDFSGAGEWTGGKFYLTPKDGGGSGDASDPCDAANASLGKGHSIGCSGVVPPGADTEVGIDLSCTSCHDPHGTALDPGTDPYINRFRNLRYNPVGGGGGQKPDTDSQGVVEPVYVKGHSYVGGVTGLQGTANANYAGNLTTGLPYNTGDAVSNHVWPVWVSTIKQNSYDTLPGAIAKSETPPPVGVDSMGSPNEGIGMWCAQCHDKWHEASKQGNESEARSNLAYNGKKIGINDCNGDGTADNGTDWRRHPVDNPLVGDDDPCSTGGVEIIRFSHYRDDIAEGFKLPAANTGVAGAIDNNKYYADDKADKVFCLSCHFVHGGPFNDNLRWDYTEGSNINGNTDNYEIKPGFQVGKAINVNIGCQQCHNR